MICFSLWFWLWCAFYNRPLTKHIILLSKCTSRLADKRIHIKLVSSASWTRTNLETCIQVFHFRSSTLNSMSLCAHPPQKLENFVFLKQNCVIWWIFLVANLVRRWQQNSSFTGSTNPNCALWENFTGGTDDLTGHPLVKHSKEYIPTPLRHFVHPGSKQMPSLPEAVKAEAS